MSCPHCGHTNPPGARFCNACGGVLAAASPPATAKAVPVRTSYTPKHLLQTILNQRSALEGERKRVTVFFADLKGSTALAAQLGDEDWHGILDRFFSILTAGIHRYEGTINQYTGDGIMALFGAPLAQEDHALRACRAALALQVELRRYADELRLQRGISLSVRMGLNSGEVVVGRIGDDLRMDYTAQGHTVNLAARMEQIAEPGRIYLTSNTAAQVEGYVQLRDLGALPVKGQDVPVRVYELEGLGRLGTRLERSRARGLSAFVGRQRELGLINEALATARDGAGQVVAISGNGGIGKSRLCHEFLEHCRVQRIPVYSATCVPYSAALPLHPVLGLMKVFFGIDDNDSALEQRRKLAGGLMLADAASQEFLPLLFEVLGVSEPGDAAVPVSPELRQTRLFDLLRRIMLPARTTPVVLMVEDLHWVDQASEQFLAELAAVVHESRALLLLNYRPEYLASWLTSGIDLELALGALKREDLIELTVQRLGSTPDMRALAARVVERAGGNPFFAEEAVQSLIEQGFLEGMPGGYRLLSALNELPLPDSVQGILAARMDRLAATEKALLQIAATLGRDFTGAELQAALRRLSPEAELEAPLNMLVETGFVHPEGEGEGNYAFCHPLMMEVAYRSQLRDRRRQVHAALAQNLEAELTATGALDERVLRLAHHWECAEDTFKAALWNLRAGVWDGQHGESTRAMPRYIKAIELLDRMPLNRELANLAVLARAGVVRTASLVPTSQEMVNDAFNEGEFLAREHQLPIALAELRLGRAALALKEGDADIANVQALSALALAREHGEESFVGRFRVPFLLVFMAAGHLREGMDLLTPPGQAAWYDCPISAENFLSRGFRGFVLTYMGRIREGRSELHTALAVELEQRRSVSWLHSMCAEVCWLSGHFESMLREARAAVARAEHFGNPQFQTFAYRVLGMALSFNGQHTEALRILEQWLPQVRAGGPAHQFESAYLAVLAQALTGCGELDRALEVARVAVASSERAHTRLWGCLALLHLARVLRMKREFAEAQTTLDTLEERVQAVGAGVFNAFIVLERGELAAAQGDRTGSETLLDAALSAFRALGAEGWVQHIQGSRHAGQGVAA